MPLKVNYNLLRGMNVVHLEAFESNLRGKKIQWFINSSTCQYPPGFQEQLITDSPQFQTRILITSPTSSEAWKLVDNWNIIYSVKNNHDWSLLLTVIINQENLYNTLVVFSPEVIVPGGFFQKIQSSIKQGKTATYLLLTYLHSVNVQTLSMMYIEALFFPGSHTLDEQSIDKLQLVLQVLSPSVLKGLVLRDSLRELRSAGAGFVLSSLESSLRQSTLYWYYASESDKKQESGIQHILQALFKRSVIN